MLNLTKKDVAIFFFIKKNVSDVCIHRSCLENQVSFVLSVTDDILQESAHVIVTFVYWNQVTVFYGSMKPCPSEYFEISVK